MLRLADVFEALQHSRPGWAEGISLTDVVIDSRQARRGSLFVALKGEVSDGHSFIGDAFVRGATAIIAEHRPPSPTADATGPGEKLNIVDGVGAESPFDPAIPTCFVVPSSLKGLQQLAAFWRRRFPQCKTIGVTGSIGKSSTKELVASVLQQRFTTLRSRGNLNNEIGLPLTLLEMNDSIERAVLEMGMYAIGEIRELCSLAQPSIGIVTNVGPSHLERLGSVEKIGEAKRELVEALPPEGSAILNGDDRIVREMANRTSAHVIYYGIDPQNDVWADEIESHGLEGIAFDLHYRSEKIRLRIPLLGRHSVHTALAATSVGLIEGLFWDEILSGLKDASAQLRLIAVPGEKGTTILDDTYNASPESSLAALNLLADLAGRKVAVLGDMLELGLFEERGHRVVGGRAAEVVSVLVTVGGRGKWIGETARAAGLKDTLFADDNHQAVDILRQVMQAGDVILVKGSRGARMEEIVSELTRPLDAMTENH